ncbi:methyl-accepting chemotaxis protein [Acidovorax sp. Root219]|uniref:methyl-accepting chemotaxis protein n=1 Tax=Acidovorax sp. Root219 TaxID=1736493 RepID=UPI0026F47492|nr:methyl-accepting chemotaxis protein [Acidovorax sp. Root219]
MQSENKNAWTLSRRLAMLNAVLIGLIAIVACTVWIMMSRAKQSAQGILGVNVPQLQTIAELELNVTRTSLQLRHAILARNPQELQTTLEDIGAKKTLLTTRLEELGRSMVEEEGRRAFAPLPGLMTEFWTVGTQNVQLIQEGKKDEAFAFLVDKTIPARNRLLVPLALEKERQAKRLSSRIDDINRQASAGRDLMIAAVMVLGLSLLGLAAYLRKAVVLRLGGEPDDLQRAAQAVARGDLATTIPLRKADESSVMFSLREMQQNLSRVVSGVRHNADSVASASSQIASGNNDLSARTEQQASALEQTAASMEELGSTVRHNADNAAQANQLALKASEVALKGGDVVAQVVTTMAGINDSSKKIADILSVIDAIAFQTNILALNAAVEAARAGEQGRGFAVVASEVRGLAQRSADAAKEIKELINTSVSRVEQGSGLVDRAGETMKEVVSSIQRVADIVAEISAASREQSAGLSQVGEAVTQLDQTTQQNAALVEEMSAAASSLHGQAQELVSAVSVFKVDQHDTNTMHPRLR